MADLDARGPPGSGDLARLLGLGVAETSGSPAPS
jgi:hypothetical protein